ncbi:MAG: 1-deoxy-D-xylulose-5-phosphate reductoisomerase, partial [Ramlibacter sp.]|nr:1-deoxy-D-xylulose-5-phosphate reductoisomerase [Ramlibacter sp.]
TTAVLNAANEVAVAAFLDTRIRFDQIHHVNVATLEAVTASNPQSLDDLLALDARSRDAAEHAISRLRN